MKELLDYFVQLGVSEIEAKLYLKLLETGHISIRQLAKILGINRTSAYLHIDQLIEKGLVMKLVKGSKKLVAANPPEDSLKNLLEKKTQSVQTIQTKFPEIIQEIKSFVPQIKPIGEAEIKYYKGENGVRNIFYEALKSKELRLYTTLSELMKIAGHIFPNASTLFEDALRENPQLKIYEIYGDAPEIIKNYSYTTESKRHTYKFMPQSVTLTTPEILLFDNKVAIVNIEKVLNVVVLNNTDYYTNSIRLFDFIWSLLPNPPH